MNEYLVYAIGFLAQLLFSSRLIVQWLKSEKDRVVSTPTIFWTLSLVASFLLFIYGYLRDDFAIMLGQGLTYFIYIRNLQLQGEWKRYPKFIQYFLIIVPVLVGIFYFNNKAIDVELLFQNELIPFWLLILGIVSQVIFTLRFVYQWIYSEYKNKSNLPMGFWIMSVIGSAFILIYAYFRADPVLLVGHSLGLFIYLRNIVILKKPYVQ